MRNWLAVVTAALTAGLPAAGLAADDLSGLLNGGYAYDNLNGRGHADQYSAQGSGLFTFGNPGFAVQLDGGNDWISDADRTDHLWSIGTDAFWRDRKGTVGLSVSYAASDGPAQPFFATRASSESFGLFGEYYALNNLTLQIKGGGATGGAESSSYFAGAGLTFYDSPDLAFHAEVTTSYYVAGRDWTNADSSLEYLPFGSVPLSFYAGYDWANISGAGYVSTVFAGFKVHFGPGRSLVDYQRSGPVEWTGQASPGARLRL